MRVLTDCPTRKLSFHSKAKAKKWIKTQHNRWNGGLRIYECPHCEHWHTTKQGRR